MGPSLVQTLPVSIDFIQPLWASLSSKEQIQKVANQGREGMKKERKSSHETIVHPWSRVLVPPQGIYMTTSLSSSARTKVLTQVEDGNFKLNTRFLEHCLPCYLATNQSEESHTPCRPHPKFCLLKTSPPKPLGSLGVLSTSHPFSLLGPAI